MSRQFIPAPPTGRLSVGLADSSTDSPDYRAPSTDTSGGSTNGPPPGFSGGGGAGSTSGEYRPPITIKRIGGKANVSAACGPCKRAHLACDVNRPCRRCANMGKDGMCEDVPVSHDFSDLALSVFLSGCPRTDIGCSIRREDDQKSPNLYPAYLTRGTAHHRPRGRVRADGVRQPRQEINTHIHATRLAVPDRPVVRVCCSIHLRLGQNTMGCIQPPCPPLRSSHCSPRPICGSCGVHRRRSR